MAQEVEKVHIKRGTLHEDGSRSLFLSSKGNAKTEVRSDFKMPMSDIWQWRLTTYHETKINNYPKPPIDRILWKPGEKEARGKARDTVTSALLERPENDKKSRETSDLDVAEGTKADNDAVKRAKAPHFPPFSL